MPEPQSVGIPPVPTAWEEALAEVTRSEAFETLRRFVEDERSRSEVFPPADETFRALHLTSPEEVRVVILGQDPYHDTNQAHGLSFSVQQGQRLPPSLRNIVKELHDDVGETVDVKHGDLTEWARQGVLLLNAVLTVQAHQANSHRGQGWEALTDAVVRHINDRYEQVVFVLWGAAAGKKQAWIDPERHAVIATAHPSPLSARRGFFGSRPFSAVNTQLSSWQRGTVDWYRPWR